MHSRIRFSWLAALCLTPQAWGAPSGDDQFFESKIRPVLASRCFACHSAQAPKLQGGLSLDSPDGIRRGGNSGPVIVAGDPGKSLLMRAIRYQDKELKMPPGKALATEVVADFEEWIRAGAVMPAAAAGPQHVSQAARFWSFVRPQAATPPAVSHADWPRNEIDRFVLAKLEQKGLAPSPRADKRTLVRRVTYDLTGLPPTAAEVDAFLADGSPDAYTRLVDRLLASPRYGERWGRYWLDIARYSDARNIGERFPWSYTYRDWVIHALNQDLPYDQFLRLQLAADRMPRHDPRDMAALGYLSLGREFPKSFPETVDDRIDVVTRGMLGLTVACARCHDHKYDPIPTKDYYSLYSIFSNIREPKELPPLHDGAVRTPLDDAWQPRLLHVREVDAKYRAERCAEMVAFFKTQIADYLIAVRDARKLTNTEREELVKDRQLNLHMLDRWQHFLAQSQTAGDPVFRLWNALADLPDAQFATGVKPLMAAQGGANGRISEAFRANPPATLRDAANLYAAVLLRYDKAEPLSTHDDELLRLALRAPQAPVNVPVSEFDLIYTEGDGNNTRGFERRYDTLRASYAYAGAGPRAMVLEDVPIPQPVHVFIRGNPNNPGVETPPHFLSCLAGPRPPTFRDGSGRLDLAEAIASRENPLTARVAVNRVWLHHFGAGLVRTPSDFGVRGDPPTHPELLDYLAVRFMQSGWSLKQLHRLILLSATYQQSSQDNPAARAKDPENALLWRANRQRLDIEALRDSILAVSGELDLRAGGPPYALTSLPSVPRRTVYGYIERGRVPGFLSNFDFASPDQHAPMRLATTVPQQALYLLNSSFIGEQARHLAHRSEIERATEPSERVRLLYRIVLGRPATAQEVRLGEQFVHAAPPETPAAKELSPWRYGYGEVDPAGGHVRSFTPFRYFVDDTWQGASMLPAAQSGNASLRANGGQPGDGLRRAAIRRWVSPVAGKISINGSLKHNQDALGTGDGVRAQVISSRLGELAVWIANGTTAETRLGGIAVQKGDTIDFVVDGRADIENDAFTWTPEIRLAGSETAWNATADFQGPGETPLSIWERYAQVLLQTNEFAFVD